MLFTSLYSPSQITGHRATWGFRGSKAVTGETFIVSSIFNRRTVRSISSQKIQDNFSCNAASITEIQYFLALSFKTSL